MYRFVLKIVKVFVIFCMLCVNIECVIFFLVFLCVIVLIFDRFLLVNWFFIIVLDGLWIWWNILLKLEVVRWILCCFSYFLDFFWRIVFFLRVWVLVRLRLRFNWKKFCEVLKFRFVIGLSLLVLNSCIVWELGKKGRLGNDM